MGVEISGLRGKQVQNSGSSRQTSSAKSSTGTRPSAAPSDDKLSLTGSASKLQALATQVAQLPVVDVGLVDETQRAIATGSFHFEPVDAAENLLTQEKELATLESQ
ncbi:MAG: flagellar biosynthesis anti-sigma factor FlgM [Gammaproteobacteria bacterium]|nr:flagellar biosynthesis anti-sigma factor FlgM [Gammaproteobacteria bacterium]